MASSKAPDKGQRGAPDQGTHEAAILSLVPFFAAYF